MKRILKNTLWYFVAVLILLLSECALSEGEIDIKKFIIMATIFGIIAIIIDVICIMTRKNEKD